MSGRVSIPTLIGSVALVGLASGAAWLVLQACALDIGPLRGLGWCQPETVRAARVQTAVLEADRGELEQRIFDLERELAAMQCTAIPPDPTWPLDPDRWANGDLGMLRGCWALDSSYRTRHVDTGEIVTYPDWRMCFDDKGNGSQVMRGSDGTVCEGPVSAAFGTNGLAIDEGGDLPCSDGGAIHRRDILCSIAGAGRASCATLQPETGGEAVVGFQRAAIE